MRKHMIEVVAASSKGVPHVNNSDDHLLSGRQMSAASKSGVHVGVHSTFAVAAPAGGAVPMDLVMTMVDVSNVATAAATAAAPRIPLLRSAVGQVGTLSTHPRTRSAVGAAAAAVRDKQQMFQQDEEERKQDTACNIDSRVESTLTLTVKESKSIAATATPVPIVASVRSMRFKAPLSLPPMPLEETKATEPLSLLDDLAAAAVQAIPMFVPTLSYQDGTAPTVTVKTSQAAGSDKSNRKAKKGQTKDSDMDWQPLPKRSAGTKRKRETPSLAHQSDADAGVDTTASARTISEKASATASATTSSGFTVPIERIDSKTWMLSMTEIRTFKTNDRQDFALDLLRTFKHRHAHLRTAGFKRVRRDFVAFARRVATIVCSEETIPHERKRFKPEESGNSTLSGARYRIGNVLVRFVLKQDELVQELARLAASAVSGRISEVNLRGDKFVRTRVDGVTMLLHETLSVVVIVGHAYLLVTATEPQTGVVITLPTPVSKDADQAMSDPSCMVLSKQESKDAKDDKDESQLASPAVALLRTAVWQIAHVSSVLIDEQRRKGRRQRLGTPFFQVPVELFWFMANFFLTARDMCHLSGTCVFTFAEIRTNVKYWKRAFQTLGNIPLYINVSLFKNDVNPIRRWSIVAMIKRRTEQRVHDYNSQVAIACKLSEEKDRSARLNSLKAQFLRKTHACPLCFKQITFQYQLNSSISKKNGFGALFMACEDCCSTRLWSHTQALCIWGFTEGQLQHLARYTMSATKFYCTADLLWLRRHRFPHFTKSVPEALLTPLQRSRLKDLPIEVAQRLYIREQTVDAAGVIWERTVNVGTGRIVVAQRPLVDSIQPSQELLAMCGTSTRSASGEPLSKRQRMETRGLATEHAVKTEHKQNTLSAPTSTCSDVPMNVCGAIGTRPLPAYLAAGSLAPTFVAYHGSEPVPVLMTFIVYRNVAHQMTEVERAQFDPPLLPPLPPNDEAASEAAPRPETSVAPVAKSP